MNEVYYFPQHTSIEQARTLLGQPDWPGAYDLIPGEMSGELLWVPFDERDGTANVKVSDHPEAALLTLPLSATGVSRLNARAASELPSDGDVITPARGGRVVYAPFWLLRTENSGKGWIAVNAHEGRLILGDLPAEPGAAGLHLAFYLVMALFCCFWGSDLIGQIMQFGMYAFSKVYLLIQAAFTGAIFLPPEVTIFTSLVGIVITAILCFLIFRHIPHILREPTTRAATGRVMLPIDCTKTSILTAGGYVSIGEAFADLFLFLDPSHMSYWKNVFTAADLFISIIFAIVLFSLAGSHARLETPKFTQPVKGKAFYPAGPIPELILTFIYISTGSLTGYLTVSALINSGFLFTYNLLFAMDPLDLLGLGARVGALIGLLPAPLSGNHRIPLIVGALGAQIGDRLLGNVGGLALTIISVFLACLFVGKQAGQDRIPGPALWNSLRMSWGLNLGSVVGSVAGRVIAIIVLGIVASKMGEIIGQIMVSFVGFLSQEKTIQREAPAKAAP